MNKKTVIEVADLVASYDDKIILDKISFSVFENEVFAVLGGSGCGKTTLLRHLLGLLKPDAGIIKILGCDITKANDDEMQPLREQIGMVFQGAALFNSMTLAENVSLPLEEYTDYRHCRLETASRRARPRARLPAGRTVRRNEKKSRYRSRYGYGPKTFIL